MSDKKYQVFISSTYADLIDERRKALDILLMADCIPAGMEAFVATDNEQFEVIKKVIDLCDYYVLIIGQRYGSISPDTGISFTEMEYDYAKSSGIPVLVFAIDETVNLPPNKKESDPDKEARLVEFRAKALTNRLATIWKTQDDLIGALAVSIMRAKAEISRPGWQRATDYDEAGLRREIMELQEHNKTLNATLLKAEETIKSLTEEPDVAFSDCIYTIEYRHSYGKSQSSSGEIEASLPKLFEYIATEMLDVSIAEHSVEDAIKKGLFSSSYAYTFKDNQLVKRILNQLKALNLVKSQWSQANKNLYWGLTPKGVKTRNDMILIKS